VPGHIECDNILVSDRGVFEVSSGKQIAGVLRPDIHRIRVAYTVASNRPLLEGIFGLLLVGVGIRGVLLCFESLKGFRYEAAMVVLGVIGAAMLWDVIKRRYVLFVTARDGRVCKLSFAAGAYSADVETFLRTVNERFGLGVQSDVRNIKI
jgi:hypothetical protein